MKIRRLKLGMEVWVSVLPFITYSSRPQDNYADVIYIGWLSYIWAITFSEWQDGEPCPAILLCGTPYCSASGGTPLISGRGKRTE